MKRDLPQKSKGRKRGLLLLMVACGIALSVVGHAQSNGGMQPNMPTAAAMAARVDAFYNHLHTLRAKFTEHYEGPGVDRTEHGVLTLAKPGRMRWDYAEPEGKLFLVDGHDAYFYSPGAGDVERVPVKKLDDLRTPLRFLLGKTNVARELDGLTLAEVNGMYRLRGVPHVAVSSNGSSQVTAITLDVTAEGEIERIAATQADGTTMTFVFTAIEKDPAVAPDAFRFTPPAGVKIIDGMETQ
jgi:outer membrane lipoprotein carrier protein